MSYAELSLNQWHELNSTKQQVQLLLDACIQAMFKRKIENRTYRKCKHPSAKQTQKWLEILAEKMQQDLQTEFLIEKMQPEVWLLEGQELYKLLFRVCFGLIFGLISGINLCISRDINFGIFGGIVIGLISYFFISKFTNDIWVDRFDQEISLVETINWSSKRAWKWLVVCLTLGLGFPLLALMGGTID